MSYTPPAGKGTNKKLNECEKRANRMALNLYSYTGEPHDNRSNVVDALTDLRHMCDAAEIDFHAACDSSYQHYLAEKRGEF